jgi:hypothetical protein
MLGHGLSIGITNEVTPFIDILAVRLLLVLLEECLFNVYHSLHHEPLSHGFGSSFDPGSGYFVLVFW